MFKHVVTKIAPVISDLINSVFDEGIFPAVLKTACVVPIFKSGQRDVVLNYRPNVTLPFLSKIYERVFFNRLTAFFNKYEIISNEQFGFLKGRSTSDAVILFPDAVYNILNRGDFLISVFLDFSKAFDTVDISILLNKLTKLGIRANSLDLIRSYLSNRKQ